MVYNPHGKGMVLSKIVFRNGNRHGKDKKIHRKSYNINKISFMDYMKGAIVMLPSVFEKLEVVYTFLLLFSFHYYFQLVKGQFQQKSGGAAAPPPKSPVSYGFDKKASKIDIRDLICHKLKNCGWKKGPYLAEIATLGVLWKGYWKCSKNWLNLPVKTTSERVHF